MKKSGLLRTRRVYRRIQYEQKMSLINLVVKEGEKVNRAAILLKIKYPAAKRILEKYNRKRYISKIVYGNNKRCSFKNMNVENATPQKTTVIVKLFGETILESCYEQGQPLQQSNYKSN